jgi:xanthine dehydrogenase accessory factor
MAASPITVMKEAIRLHEEGTPFCVVTVVDARGSIPQEIGARAIVGHDGLIHGTIGGGRIEARGCERARELLTPGSNRAMLVERVNLHRDVGMTCAGEMTLVYEVFRPDFEWNIVIFGAGHIAQKLCRFLAEMDCRITCIDTRPEWLGRLPDNGRVRRRLVGNFEDGADHVTRGAFVLVMTMGHTTDLPVLHALSERQLETGFLGVLGSDGKAAIMKRELRQSGLSEDFVSRITCPIGEKFGDNTPPEIAASILTMLLRKRHGA